MQAHLLDRLAPGMDADAHAPDDLAFGHVEGRFRHAGALMLLIARFTLA